MSIDITAPNRVPLPGGAWADLRPVQDITERRRRPIRNLTLRLVGDSSFVAQIKDVADRGLDPRAFTDEDAMAIADRMRPETLELLEEIQDMLIVAAVRGWSFRDENDAPIPVTVEGILDLPGVALDELRVATAPYQNALNPNLAQPTPDPASPTGPSSA